MTRAVHHLPDSIVTAAAAAGNVAVGAAVEAAAKGFDQAAIFRESQTAIAGGVDQCCLAGVFSAAVENHIVDEAACGIGIKFGAKHRG